MGMIKKSITVTEQQDSWLKAQIASGHYGNESEVVRDLIRERQMGQQDTPEQIAAIRAALIEGEQSGLAEPFDASQFKKDMAEKHAAKPR